MLASSITKNRILLFPTDSNKKMKMNHGWTQMNQINYSITIYYLRSTVLICGSNKIPGGVNHRGFCFWLALLAGARLRLGTLAGGLRFFFFLAQKDSGFGSIELGRGPRGTRRRSSCCPDCRSPGTLNGSHARCRGSCRHARRGTSL